MFIFRDIAPKGGKQKQVMGNHAGITVTILVMGQISQPEIHTSFKRPSSNERHTTRQGELIKHVNTTETKMRLCRLKIV